MISAPTPPPPSASSTPLRVLQITALVATLLSLGNALWAAWDQGVTYDEPFHLRWAQRLLDDRDDARDQFRFDSKTPALLPSVLLQKGLKAADIISDHALLFASRVPSVALLGLALVLVMRLARSDDPRTAWIGLLIAALDPNLAANASIATTDLAYTVVVLLFAVAAQNSRGTMTRSALLGATVGLAFSVKFTAVLLVPVAVGFIAFRGGERFSTLAKALVAATAVAILVMNVAYLGVGSLSSLTPDMFQTAPFKSLASALGQVPIPLPRSVLTGLDASIAHNDGELWASYVFGKEHRGGVWYYFIANWLMKTPVTLVLLVCVGLARVARSWRTPSIAITTILLLVHGIYFSFFFATQIGLRFALPCVALALALVARGLSGVNPRWLIAAAAFAVAERVPYHSDPIAFTNLSVWPKSRAYWYTADSNLDYGQNRERLARYAAQSGEAMVLDQPVITPGWYVLGANELTIFDTRRRHRWLIENNVPAMRVGFTDFAFSITGERFDQYLNDARLVEAANESDGRCSAPLDHYTPGSQIPFDQNTSPGEGRLWVVCVTSRKGADVGFTASAGRLWFGRVTAGGVCDADLLQQGQQAWFRVPRGEDARLCLREIPYRRSELAYLTSGYLTIRGQGADVAVRAAPLASLRLNDR